MNYITLAKRHQIEILVNKSKFIATASPVRTEEEASKFISEMKKEYWDATHNVYAYVIGENNDMVKSSDDGEPSGTAGRPTLEALKMENIKYTAVVVTRYFGGILLGASGLVRAYGKATKECISTAQKLAKRLCQSIEFEMQYSDYNGVERFIKNFDCFLINSKFEENVKMSLLIPVEGVEEFDLRMKELLFGNYNPQRLEIEYKDVEYNDYG